MHPSYRRLREHLKEWAIGFPDSPVMEALLETRLNPEEAELLADFPFFPHTLEQLSLHYGLSSKELSEKLDPLALKGIVFRHESKTAIRYALNDSMFTFYRSPFWAGKDDDSTRHLASLSNTYFSGPYGPELGKVRIPAKNKGVPSWPDLYRA